VEAIEMNGGHVLKFIGDGILAIFPDDDSTQACARALDAAAEQKRRVGALCRSLEQPVIVSSAFADAAGQARERLVSLGRYAMKGVARPQELFTLDPGWR
jgi:adenylate cyclase